MRMKLGTPMATHALALIMLGALCCAAQAQSFSADLIAYGVGGEKANTGRVHVSADKIRIEAPELPEGFFIDNIARKSAYYVRPINYLYMDAKQSSVWTQLLVPLDPEDPCEHWHDMAQVAGAPAGWRCTRLGHEIIGGHLTVLYRVYSPRGGSNLAWIDAKRKFLVKYRNENGSGLELVNIDDAPQDGALFKIPHNYEKFDPQELIARVKDSDVWVEPVK